MNILALDGALGGFSAAVARHERLAASLLEPGNVALERGLQIVKAVLERTSLAPRSIDRLAVGIGPGTFTGLRIAIAYAKSLAAAWQRPLVPISSFDLLEFGQVFSAVFTVVAGRPGVISARYRNGSDVRRASGRTADVLELLAPPQAVELTVLGAPEDVLHALAERANIVRSVDPIIRPAAAAAALAAGTRTPPSSLHEVRADYGELPAVSVRKR